MIFNIISRINQKIAFWKEVRVRPFYYSIILKKVGAKVKFGKNIRIGKQCKFNFAPGSFLEIGDRVVIMENCKLICPDKASIEIGENSYIGPNSEIFSRSSVKIGKFVLLAQQCIVIDYNHKYGNEGVIEKKFNSRPIEIGDKSWLGARTIVLAGVNIGAKSIVGAQETVRQNLPEKSLFINGQLKTKQ